MHSLCKKFAKSRVCYKRTVIASPLFTLTKMMPVMNEAYAVAVAHCDGWDLDESFYGERLTEVLLKFLFCLAAFHI